MAKRRRSSGSRDYPRTARLNELLREIISEELTRLDDDRLGWVSVTEVDVDTELTFARVYLSTLDDDPGPEFFEALDEHEATIKRALSRSRLRRTPALEFSTDPSIRSASRVEEILQELADTEGADDAADDPPVDEA